jgi:nucleoid-associated protein YgaU
MHYYGDAKKYKEIFSANSDILKNANLIYPDQELIIPNL